MTKCILIYLWRHESWNYWFRSCRSVNIYSDTVSPQTSKRLLKLAHSGTNLKNYLSTKGFFAEMDIQNIVWSLDVSEEEFQIPEPNFVYRINILLYEMMWRKNEKASKFWMPQRGEEQSTQGEALWGKSILHVSIFLTHSNFFWLTQFPLKFSKCNSNSISSSVVLPCADTWQSWWKPGEIIEI